MRNPAAAIPSPTSPNIIPVSQKARFRVIRVIEQITSPASSITSPKSNRSARRRSIETSVFRFLGLRLDFSLLFFVALHFLGVFCL